MKLRDSQGRLTAEGRRFFKANDGANLRQPVADYDSASDEDKRRWVGFVRTFAGLDQIPAVRTPDGSEPTQYAQLFSAWGEDTPKTLDDVRAIVEKARQRQEELGLSPTDTVDVITGFSQEADEINAFLADDVEPVPIYELFCADGAVGEASAPADSSAGEKTIIPKTILRTGTWKLRPSPRGPVRKTLKVFRDKAPAGHISLTELKKNFDAGAIDHVTVPLTHEDKTDENTGFVRALQVKDNKDGSSELVADIEFTEPDIAGKVQRGTIPNVSSGVLFDFIHKETAKKFKQVLAHVCLTGKPWINGMPPFPSGVAATDDFNAEEVVSFEFSDDTTVSDELEQAETTNAPWDPSGARFTDEQYARACLLDRGEGPPRERFDLPIREPGGAININALGAIAAKVAELSDGEREAVVERLKIAYKTIGQEPPDTVELAAPKKPKAGATVWKAEEGTAWIRAQVTRRLREMRQAASRGVYGGGYDGPYYSVEDVSNGKALITEGYGPDQTGWVANYTITDGELALDAESDWTQARPEWVAASQSLSQETELAQSGMTPNEKKLYDRVYSEHLKRPGVKPDAAKAAAQQAVKNSRRPKGSVASKKSAKMTDTQRAGRARDLRLSEGRPVGQRTGGSTMGLKVEELLARGVQLSEEEQAEMRADEQAQEARDKELDELKRAQRRDGSKSLLEQIEKLGFASPGVEKYVKSVFQDDDGETALTFQDRNDEGTKVGDPKPMTASEILAGFIDALPKDRDSGKLSFAQQVRQSPDDHKPPDEPKPDADLSDDKAEQRATELAEELDVPWARGKQPAGASNNGGGAQ